MALAKYFEEIIERRATNGAAIIFEYQYPHVNAKRVASTASPEEYLIPQSDIAELRLWPQRVTRECEERLAREETLVFKLNEQRTRASVVGFVTKGEAARTLGVFECELLDLDDLYGGMFVRACHLFISETKVADGLRRYAPVALLDGLLKERQQAPEGYVIPQSKLAELRLWMQQATRECEERLAGEETLVFKLNEQRTRASVVGFVTKGKAARTLGVFECELLDLDDLYGGMFVRADHLFISEAKVADGLRRYAPATLLDGLLNERQQNRASTAATA